MDDFEWLSREANVGVKKHVRGPWDIPGAVRVPVRKPDDPDWHKFLGDSGDDTGPKPQVHILCWSITGVQPPLIDDHFLNVTILNSLVTCQTCLEIIHS